MAILGAERNKSDGEKKKREDGTLRTSCISTHEAYHARNKKASATTHPYSRVTIITTLSSGYYYLYFARESQNSETVGPAQVW